MVPLIVGTILALAALAYVLWPLIAADGRTGPRNPAPQSSGDITPVPPALLAEAEDPVEVEIRRARVQLRVCPRCGPRPEPTARYCSSCGAALT